MRPLIGAGHVFAAQPPLFSAKVSGETYRAFSDQHRDEITAELCKGNRRPESIKWQRFKGLGEMNVDELEHAALNPETRILRRLTIEDVEKEKRRAEKMFEVLMGSDVSVRRDYIIKNSDDFDAAALDV